MRIPANLMAQIARKALELPNAKRTSAIGPSPGSNNRR